MNVPDAGDEPLPDRAARLPGERPAPGDVVDEQPVLRRWAGHDEQSRGVLPWLPGQANQSSTAVRRAAGCGRHSGTRWSTSSASATAARLSFSPEQQFTKSLWEGPVANQGGYYLNFANSMGFTRNIQTYMNAGPGGTTSSRDAYHRMFEDNFNWLKGAHSITIGGNYTNYQLWNKGQQIVPELRFGVVDWRSRRGHVPERGELPRGLRRRRSPPRATCMRF